MSEPYLARLGRWVAALEYDSIPADTLTAARYQVLNMLAALHASARSTETSSIACGLTGFSVGAGRSTAFATGIRHAPHEAVLSNAAYSMAQDFDDIVWMGHTCHSSVFAPLAVAQHEGRDARAFLTAVVAANEIGGRLGATSFLGPLNGQMWTFIHLIGAAGATAKVLGLDAEQTTHALAISLAQPNFALQPGFMTPSSKLLAAATPAAAGIQAAYFARAGMTGAPDIIEDRRGFWKRFTYLPLPFMMEGLGSFWTTQTLTIKTFPGCHYFQTAVSAIDEIERVHGPVDVRQVRRIRAETTKLGFEATRFAGEYSASVGRVTPINVNFDLGVTVAIRLIAGKLTSEQMHPEWLEEHSAEIRALASKTAMIHDPQLTAKTVASVRAVSSGRAALKSVRLSELPGLVRKYRQEYRSQLVTPSEVAGWLRVAGQMRQKRAQAPEKKRERSAIPLYFPNRVSIELGSGRTLSAQTDLPAGSFCNPEIRFELKEKFIRETAPVLGAARAEKAFAAGLGLGDTELGEFAALVAKPA